MPSIQWISVNPKTGLPIAELPGVRTTSTLTTIMGSSGGTVTIEIPVTDRLPSTWRQATEPHQVVIACQYDDPAQTVVWAGIPIIRDTGSDPTIRLTLDDAHGYLRRQHLPYFGSWTDESPIEIAHILMADGFFDYYPRSGLAGTTSETIDMDVPVTETVYDALIRLTQTAQVEWLLDWRWAHPDGETEWGTIDRLWLSLTVDTRIGKQATETVEPHAFSQVAWTRTEDWSRGRGATRVIAVGQTSGDDDPPFAVAATSELMQLTETIDVDSDNQSVLQDAAGQRLAELRDGTIAYDVELIIAESDIILGKDIGIGDDVIVDLENPDLTDLNHSFAARMVGWTAEPDIDSGEITKLKPILIGRG